ncbi:MAG: hypothetical protein H0X62_08580 [Bacteroidetes bacterium]|nr:hypothetical protein [Bacteroidota bacterium]
MKTFARTVIMQGSPPEGKLGSRHLALTSMLLMCVHNELFSKEIELISRLSGKSFSITLAGESGHKFINDKLYFKDDYVSNDNQIFSLKQTEFTASESEGAIKFEAETINETDGVRIWKGYVKDKKIEGIMVWARAGQPVESYSFSGVQI